MAPRNNPPVLAFALILLGLGLSLLGAPGSPGGGGLAATARALCVQHVTAPDRAAQAASAATIYVEAADRLGSKTYTSAIEAQQHILDRVQRELVPRSAGWSAVNAELAAAVRGSFGPTPDAETLRGAYTGIAAGLKGVK